MVPFPTRLGSTSDEGLPTASSVAAGTESAARTLGERAVVPGSAVADDPPAVRCDDAAADGLEVPAALTTIMVAMAATTRMTGTRAVMSGWRERNRARDAPAVDEARALETGRVVDDFLVFVVGRAERDGRGGPVGPMGDFDMVFSWVDRGGDEAHTLGGSKRRPGAVSGADDGAPRAHANGRPDARQARCRARRTGAGGTAGLVHRRAGARPVPAGDGQRRR